MHAVSQNVYSRHVEDLAGEFMSLSPSSSRSPSPKVFQTLAKQYCGWSSLLIHLSTHNALKGSKIKSQIHKCVMG